MKMIGFAFAALSSLSFCGIFGQGIATAASGQNYPTRPLRAVVPTVPGGGTDTTARIIATGLSEALGAPVVVDNRAGAGGTIATAIVAKAPSDGYTVLMGNSSTHGINPAVLTKLPYDPMRDFAPISMIGTTPNVLVVHPSLPVRTMSEFIAYAKANPGKILYGSSGIGGSPHLAMELLRTMTGVNIVHVPYKGGAGAIGTGLLSGEVHCASTSLIGMLPYIKSGQLRALAITTTKRNDRLPEVPTMIESGIKGYNMTIWYALFAPAGVPKPIIARLNKEMVKLLNASEIKTRLGQAGIDAAASTPEELAAFVKTEVAKWTGVGKAAGVKPGS